MCAYPVAGGIAGAGKLIEVIGSIGDADRRSQQQGIVGDGEYRRSLDKLNVGPSGGPIGKGDATRE